MDFKTQGDAIAQRKQKAWTGFQQTIQPGKFYTQEDIKIKNKWVKEIEAANDEWREWLSSI
ncbi:hypothetical protein Lste_2444 [Legionella steelei]|uniref:Uncharacterized protein n=1 Tax=Legionella steelei TaxID=947033 RepID=A0A0W0ZKD5_9GAMM|nr:hypothetical protein [Legionella steelei]KTD69286.1 hypothetical protein Lste_2444 [Legionella steelei]